MVDSASAEAMKHHTIWMMIVGVLSCLFLMYGIGMSLAPTSIPASVFRVGESKSLCGNNLGLKTITFHPFTKDKEGYVAYSFHCYNLAVFERERIKIEPDERIPRLLPLLD